MMDGQFDQHLLELFAGRDAEVAHREDQAARILAAVLLVVAVGGLLAV